VPLIIQLIDVNDETPTFEKALYEFILTSDLRNFTIPAYIKAIDNDAEAPNNVVRYELTQGNYQNKFSLNEVTGQLMLRDALPQRKQRQTAEESSDVIVLTARAFDLGVPVRHSTTTIRVYPPESRTRAVAFLVPGYSHDREELEETLASLTGGKVMIQDIKRYEPSGQSKPKEEKSLVTATVIYNTEKFVDVSEIQKRLTHSDDKGISVADHAVSHARPPKEPS
jgi:hypothetical protein